jgi:hypothetical protein
MRDSNGPSLADFLAALPDAGNYPHVAGLAGELAGDANELWTRLADGAGLLWLAASVGVDPRTVASIALEALSSAEEEVEVVCVEVHDVLFAARARLAGQGSEKALEEARTDAYCRIAFNREPPLPDDADVVTDAAVYAAQATEWAAHATGNCQATEHFIDPAELGPSDAAMVLATLATLRPVQQGLDGRDPGWKAELAIEAARWADFVRARIDFSQVLAGVHRAVDGRARSDQA